MALNTHNGSHRFLTLLNEATLHAESKWRRHEARTWHGHLAHEMPVTGIPARLHGRLH
jgi:hypothetical protein